MSNLPFTPLATPTYETVSKEYAAPLGRLVRGYEADADRQRDLLQEIHLGLWRSLPSFDGRSSVRTWVYRVAHNIAVTHVIKGGRWRPERAIPIEELEERLSSGDGVRQLENRDLCARLAALVRELRPLDRQIILLYLDGFDHSEISGMAGISKENAATKVHRIKQALDAAFSQETSNHG